MSDDVPEAVRNNCYERDNYRCRMCGATNVPFHLHHILYRSQGGPHTRENLITLCFRCHDTAHSNKRFWQPVLQDIVMMTDAITAFQYVRWKKKAGIRSVD